MNWKEIQISNDHTQFIINGKPIFNKTFLEVLKFHTPGFAPVQDETGWYHIDTNGTAVYAERYKRVFGYYCNRAAVTDLENNCFHIDEKGKRVYAQNFTWCGNF